MAASLGNSDAPNISLVPVLINNDKIRFHFIRLRSQQNVERKGHLLYTYAFLSLESVSVVNIVSKVLQGTSINDIVVGYDTPYTWSK